MGFQDFHGNTTAVTTLRSMIAAGRMPHGLILTGPPGAGKYTLSIMLAQAINCLVQPVSDGLPDFCGTCGPCVSIQQSMDLEARVADAIAAREELRDADKRETRILIQTFPDLLIVPPDPPQLLVKVGQVRTVIASSQRHPAEGRRRIFLFPAASFMKEAANSLLKVLEEPPPSANFILLAENAGELLPTIRSRCALLRLAALSVSEIVDLLASRRPDWKQAERELVARLSQGAIGRALHFPLEEYRASRLDALTLLRSSIGGDDHSALFRVTEAYRAGGEGQQKTLGLLRSVSRLLEDMMMLQNGAPELVRNIDIRAELERMAAAIDFPWIERAVTALGSVESGLRRNLLRSLSLDAFAAKLERA